MKRDSNKDIKNVKAELNKKGNFYLKLKHAQYFKKIIEEFGDKHEGNDSNSQIVDMDINEDSVNKIEKYSSSEEFSEIQSEETFVTFTEQDVQNQKLIKSNLLYNLYDLEIENKSYYALEIKYILFTMKEFSNTFENYIKSSTFDKSHLFLKKKGYFYNNKSKVLTIIYFKHDAELFENFDFSSNPDYSYLANIIGEKGVRFALFHEFFKKFQDAMESPFTSSILHPDLFFFSKKKGILYIDHIFAEIYFEYKLSIPVNLLIYYGKFNGNINNNSLSNLFLCLLIYYIQKGKEQTKVIPYELILYLMKSDFLHSNNHFHELSSKVNDKDLQNFVSSVTYFHLKNGTLLNDLEYKDFYLKNIFSHAECQICGLTSKQKDPQFFIFVLDKKCFYCQNCHQLITKETPESNKLSDFTKELMKIKTLFTLKKVPHKLDFKSIYIDKCESVINQIQSDFKEKEGELINIEKKSSTILSLISSKLKYTFRNIMEKYGKTKIENKVLKNDIVGKISTAYNNYIDIKNKVTQFEYETIQKTSIILSKASSIANKSLKLKFKVANIEYFNKEKELLKKYQINSELRELGSRKKINCVCYLQKHSRRIHAINMSNNYYSYFDIPIKIEKGARYLNMKSFFFICGGHFSKLACKILHDSKSETFTRNTGKKGLELFKILNEMKYEHESHVVINVLHHIYVIGGKFSTKCEKYNILSNKWEDIHKDLPFPISNAAGVIVNGINIYIFFGLLIRDNKLSPNHSIYKLPLFTPENGYGWQKIKVTYTSQFAPRFNFAIVPFTKNIFLITGGKKYITDGEKEEFIKTDEFFSFNIQNNTVKKEKEDPKWNHQGIAFKEGCYLQLESESKGINVWGIWGDNEKLIKIKNKSKSNFFG